MTHKNRAALIDATHDAITCPQCRTAVPDGRVCGCPMRTNGPAVENVTRKIATGQMKRPR